MKVDLYPHQKEAVEALSNGKVLWGGVGTGKSLTVLAYYFTKLCPDEHKKDIYVITTAKKRDEKDWEGEAAKFGISTVRELSSAGTIHVDSWNNVGKYVDVKDAYFIFDEQRVVGTGAWAKAFVKIARANAWNLLSATPGDTWMDYIPVFLANNLYKNKTQFIREHVVYAPYSRFPVIKRYMEVSTLERYRNMILVEMPFARHTERHLEWLKVEYDEEKYKEAWKTRWNPYTDEPMQDVGELFRVVRRITGEAPQRLSKVRELMKTHNRIIVFYNFNYELEELRKLGSKDVEVGEWNGKVKTPVPTSEKWVHLVQYAAGAEGWNCVATDAMVFYSPTYSYKNFEQSQGRIDRLNTDFVDLYYYVLTSNSPVDVGIRRSLESKQHFNELDFVNNKYCFNAPDFMEGRDQEFLPKTKNK